MSDEKMAEFERQLGMLKWIAGLGWALLVGAFGLGVWVATIQLAQTSQHAILLEHTSSIKQHSIEINMLHVQEARVGTDLAYIKETLSRIEKKLP